MKPGTAIKKAIDAMEKRRQNFAVDHNLYIAGVISERTEKAHKEYTEINKAIEIIKAITRQGRLL